MLTRTKTYILFMVVGMCGLLTDVRTEEPLQISGMYPHLAMFGGGSESGVGAVVVWNDRLWTLTYTAHALDQSGDKLWSIGSDLTRRVEADYGGTHAGRMIHGPTNQMVIGRYIVEADSTVHTVPITGRLTAAAEHLSDPDNKIYIYAMDDDKLWEVDMNTYDFTRLSQKALPGVHGKGAYTGQGRLVVGNNGEEGVLAEWDGSAWTIIDETNYTDVTGPGGIYGSPTAQSPIWAIGWDEKSGKLAFKDNNQWYFYRLPIASHTYTFENGWYTEWPRIREVADDLLLADHLGLFYRFPKTFSLTDTAGIEPISTHLKMVVDFTGWNGVLVMGNNDASTFNNPTVSDANSNLWFGQVSDLSDFGPRSGMGGVWTWDDEVDPSQGTNVSDPMLFAGFERRSLHLKHYASTAGQEATFTIQLDVNGDGNWTDYDSVSVPDESYRVYAFPPNVEAEWVRLSCDIKTKPIAYFRYIDRPRTAETQRFQSLAEVGATQAKNMGLLVQKKDNGNVVQYVANHIDSTGTVVEKSLYEIQLNTNNAGLGTGFDFVEVDDAATISDLESKYKPVPDVTVDDASIIFAGSFRLPKGHVLFDDPTAAGPVRNVREVVTERSLINAHGTIFELPRHTNWGIRAITTHNREIYDFMSWRGLLVMSGTLANAAMDGHYFASEDGEVGLWFGSVDDLWSFGVPTGEGGPWLNTTVAAGDVSDPYLMAGYDKKSLELSHTSNASVEFGIEIDFRADGTFYEYKRVTVPPGEKYAYTFPESFDAQWIRFKAYDETTATAWLTYGVSTVEDSTAPALEVGGLTLRGMRSEGATVTVGGEVIAEGAGTTWMYQLSKPEDAQTIQLQVSSGQQMIRKRIRVTIPIP